MGPREWVGWGSRGQHLSHELGVKWMVLAAPRQASPRVLPSASAWEGGGGVYRISMSHASVNIKTWAFVAFLSLTNSYVPDVAIFLRLLMHLRIGYRPITWSSIKETGILSCRVQGSKALMPPNRQTHRHVELNCWEMSPFYLMWNKLVIY